VPVQRGHDVFVFQEFVDDFDCRWATSAGTASLDIDSAAIAGAGSWIPRCIIRLPEEVAISRTTTGPFRRLAIRDFCRFDGYLPYSNQELAANSERRLIAFSSSE